SGPEGEGQGAVMAFGHEALRREGATAPFGTARVEGSQAGTYQDWAGKEVWRQLNATPALNGNRRAGAMAGGGGTRLGTGMGEGAMPPVGIGRWDPTPLNRGDGASAPPSDLTTVHTTPKVHPIVLDALPLPKAAGSGVSKTTLYASYLGGPNADNARALAVDAAGDAYVTGSFGNAGGGTDIVLAKIDPNGALLFGYIYAFGGGDGSGNGIVVDALGDAFVTGSGADGHGGTDTLLAKFRPNGPVIFPLRFR